MRPFIGRPAPAQRRWLLWLGLIASVSAITVLGAGRPAWAGTAAVQTVPTLTKSPTAGPSPTVTSAASATPPATATPSPVPPTATPTPGRIRPTVTPIAPSNTPTPGAGTCLGDARALGLTQTRGPWSLGRRSARIWLFAWPGLGDTDDRATPCRIVLSAVPVHRLPAPPAGWALASGGARLTPLDTEARVMAVETPALMVCFQRPAAPRPASGWSVAAANPASSNMGWIHLTTRAVGGAMCGRSESMPATFALLAEAN